VLTRIASKAYRRPATPEEVERLAKLVDQATGPRSALEAGIQLADPAILVSPKFLFRVELDDRPTAAEAHPSMNINWRHGCRISSGPRCPTTSFSTSPPKKELTKEP